MKKIIKYFFIILATLFIFAAFSLMLILNEVDDDSDNKEELAASAMMQIASYYDKNGYYPKSLQELPLYSSNEFANHVKKRSFQYASYGGDKPKYVFSWRGGAMNWTGYRCTNDKSVLSKEQYGVIRTYQRADGAVCTVRDLH